MIRSRKLNTWSVSSNERASKLIGGDSKLKTVSTFTSWSKFAQHFLLSQMLKQFEQVFHHTKKVVQNLFKVWDISINKSVSESVTLKGLKGNTLNPGDDKIEFNTLSLCFSEDIAIICSILKPCWGPVGTNLSWFIFWCCCEAKFLLLWCFRKSRHTWTIVLNLHVYFTL